ncbi:unnamed protein product, partial [Hapterophycus canaliculatus]
MQVTIGGEAVQHCTPPLSNDSVLSREYDGMSVYSPPPVCSLDYPTLTVVHGDLHTASCTAEEVANSGDEGLSAAVVGAPARFHVVARDAFGNIRTGDSTTHFGGYGDGSSDVFMATLSGANGYRVVTSSAVQTITVANGTTEGAFRVYFAGDVSRDIPNGASAAEFQ